MSSEQAYIMYRNRIYCKLRELRFRYGKFDSFKIILAVNNSPFSKIAGIKVINDPLLTGGQKLLFDGYPFENKSYNLLGVVKFWEELNYRIEWNGKKNDWEIPK
jgi:hypothetical protein